MTDDRTNEVEDPAQRSHLSKRFDESECSDDDTTCQRARRRIHHTLTFRRNVVRCRCAVDAGDIADGNPFRPLP